MIKFPASKKEVNSLPLPSKIFRFQDPDSDRTRSIVEKETKLERKHFRFIVFTIQHIRIVITRG